MKFIIKEIPARLRNNLQDSLVWLRERQTELATKLATYKQDEAIVARKRQRAAELDDKAAEDIAAASELSALKLQLSKLGPRLSALRSELETEIAKVPRQIAGIREGDIRPAVSEPLQTLLKSQVRERIAGLFSPSELPGEVETLAGKSWQGRKIFSYVAYRGSPPVQTYDDADSVLTETIAEIERILNGEPLPGFDVDAA